MVVGRNRQDGFNLRYEDMKGSSSGEASYQWV